MRRFIALAATAVALVAAIPAAPATAHALGLGVAVSRLAPENGENNEADARGVFGRFQLVGPIDLELHVARLDYSDPDGSEHSARRYGIGLHVDLLHIGKWVPFLVGATGVIELAGDTPDYVFDEIGGGIGYQLNERLDVELDFRQGRVRPASDVDPENYQQIQLGLALSF
jgi:hypothetical protein